MDLINLHGSVCSFAVLACVYLCVSLHVQQPLSATESFLVFPVGGVVNDISNHLEHLNT